MSSSNRVVNTSELVFVPTPVQGIPNGDGFEGLPFEVQGHAFKVAAGFAQAAALSAGSDAEAVAGEEPWTPERIEALERSAFDRGVESAIRSNGACARAFDALERASRELDAAAATSVIANRELVLQLAIEIAERWVGAELSADPTLFTNALDLAIENCDGKTVTTLFLSADDHEALLTNEPQRIANWQQNRAVIVKQDETLSPGTFRLDGSAFTLDGTPDAIRDRLRDALSGAFEASLPEAGE